MPKWQYGDIVDFVTFRVNCCDYIIKEQSCAILNFLCVCQGSMDPYSRAPRSPKSKNQSPRTPGLESMTQLLYNAEETRSPGASPDQVRCNVIAFFFSLSFFTGQTLIAGRVGAEKLKNLKYLKIKNFQ